MKRDDKMNRTTTMIVAAIVVIVIVVAAAAVVITNNGGSDNGSGAGIDSQLQIRGNANGDHTIDGSDLEILEDVISGTSSLEDYPLADVNNDGVVDESDRALLQDLVDRKDGTTVYVMCLDRSGNSTTVECTYPLRNVVTYATNMQMPVLYANGGQYIAGYFTSSYEVAEGSISDSAVELGGSNRSIPDSAWMNFTQLDAGLSDGVGAFLTDYSAVAQITDARQSDLDAAGIPLIIYPSADATDEITTVLTLGFLFGGDCERLGVEYAQASWDVVDRIQEVISGLSDDEKVSYICCTMWYYICENDSTYNSSASTAGGVPYYTVNPQFAAAYAGDGSTAMSSVEALSNYQDVGVVINNRSLDFGLDTQSMTDTVLECWEHDCNGHPAYEYFRGLEDRTVFINNILPGAVKLAYMAHAMYGDDLSREWADGVLQEFIDMGTAPLDGQTIDSVPAYVDWEMYQTVRA